MNKYYQQGGEIEQLMQLFQAFADTVQDDEFSTAEEVMQMFQELSPEEQQAFVQQAMQIVQGSEESQEQVPELEEQPTMQRGGYVNNTGYLEGYETSKNPFNIIKSNRITMKNVDPKIKYIKGTDNLGNTQYMEHGGEYEFDGDFVLEEPVYAQTGEKIYRFNPEKNKFTQRKTSTESLKKIKPQLTFTKKELKPLTSSAKVSADVMSKEQQLNAVFRFNDLVDKVKSNQLISPKETTELNLLAKQLGEAVPKSTFLKSKFPNILETVQEVSKEIADSKFGKVTSKVLKSPITKNTGKALGYIGTAATLYDAYEQYKNLDNPDYILTDRGVISKEEYNQEHNQFKKPVLPENKTLPKISKGVDYEKIFGGKQETAFEFLPKTDNTKSTSLKQDKPKLAPLPKKVNKQLSEQVATPDVLVSPPVPTEVPEELNYDFRVPLMDVGNYYIPQEEREVNINPNAFNRTNVGVGKRFFKQRGGNTLYVDSKNNPRYKAYQDSLSLYNSSKNPKIKNPSAYNDWILQRKDLDKDFLKEYPLIVQNPNTINKKILPVKEQITGAKAGSFYQLDFYKKPTRSVKLNERNKINNLSQLKSIPYEQKEDVEYNYPEINFTPSQEQEYYNPERVIGSEYNQNPDASYGRFQKKKSEYYDKQLQEMNKKQYGGATETNFNSRLNPNADINIGAETEQQFYQPYTQKKKLFPSLNFNTPLDNNQYDTIPMGVNSINYKAPDAESRRMFEGRSSDQLLDLGNYASRFGEDDFGMTTPVSNQTVDRKSKFQEFMDKYGKKSDFRFKNNARQIAPLYNLLESFEPIAPVYRPQIDVKYAETPMLDPLPIIQQLQNQQRLATQNVNTNSPTGQSFISNLNAKLQDKTSEVLNDIQQKNQQIAAQNEQARINAYNQEQQLNIAANQQALATQMQRKAIQSQMRGKAFNDIDAIAANKEKMENYYSSLPLYLDDIELSKNPYERARGVIGFDKTKSASTYYNPTSSTKTLAQIQAEEKAKKAAQLKAAKLLEQQQEVAQIGGSINQFLKRRF